MTHVVTENCIKCKHTDCVDVCPVDCFRETQYMLVIDPDECIDCAVCIPECPSNAIFAEEDVPIGQEQFIEFNRIMTPAGSSITRSKKPFLDADFWNGVSGKAAFLGTESVGAQSSTNPSTHTLYFHLSGAAELSDNEWTENLNSPNPKVRYLLASRKDFRLDADRLSQGLRDEDPQVRMLYLKLGKDQIPDSDVELLLNDPDTSIRLAILNEPTIGISDAQFYKSLESDNPIEIRAALNKMTADRVLPLLNHRSVLVRSSAYGSELTKLSSAQIEIGLNDSEPEVKNAILRRTDFSPSPTQFVALLEAENDGYGMYAICRNANDECIARVMSDANPTIISRLIVGSTLLSSEHKIQALSMGDDQLSLTVLNDFGKKITKQAVEIGLCSESEDVRLRAVELRGVKKLTEQQIAQCLNDPSDKIRSIIVRSVALSAEQIENASTDSSELVRLALVRRKDFFPSVKQLRRGLKDKCDEVRQGFSERFQLSKGKVTGIASRGISRVLNELAGIPTWTKEKYQLQSELLSLIDDLEYFQFAVDARDASFTRFGEHGIIDVPTNQRGSLKDMRGKKIHLICIGSGPYSTIYLAAKPIDHVNSDTADIG